MKTKITLFKIITLIVLEFSFTKISSQITLVEAAGVGSQDVARVSTSGSALYFVGREQGGGATDVYLWSNDGTTSTKILLLGQLTQNISPSYFFPCGGKTFFFYSNGVSANGYEPWVTDGTAAGTMMIKDINPGAGSSVASNGTQTCFCFNNKIYFAPNDGINGNELWVSDGTSAGTIMVKDIKSGSSGSNIAGFVNYKNEMYFTAKAGNYDELWHSDGTLAGTLKITNPAALNGYESGTLILHDSLLFFTGKNTSNDIGVWRTNGTTAGTYIVPGTLPSTPLNAIGPYINLGNELLFGYQYFSGGYAYRLYKTDGLSITQVKDSINFKTPILLGNKIIFKGEVTGSGTLGEPWVSDGTTAGTFKLNTISWSTAGTFRNVSAPFNNKLYFAVTNALWETDGTVSGTKQNTAATGTIWDFAELNNNLYLNAQNAANGNRQELFKLNTTSVGLPTIDAASSINIYPNPTNGMFTIYGNATSVEVYNMLGEVVFILANHKQQLTNEIDLSNAPKGIYFVRLYQGTTVATQKIVVQ